MKNHTKLLICSSTLVCILLLSGCSSNKPSLTAVQEILTKAKTITSMKYDEVVTVQNNSINRSITIWEKPPYMKFYESQGNDSRVFINRPEGVYVELPDKHIFVRSNITLPEESLITLSEKLLSSISFSIVGSETINSVATTILQYSNNTSNKTTTTKVWIWNDKGIPIQTQVTLHIGSITLITTKTMKNFDFSTIPDSEFSVV